MYKYYLTQRGPGPGCQPKDFVAIKDYGIKRFVEGMNIRAWGYIWYDRKLTDKEIQEYELLEDGNNE